MSEYINKDIRNNYKENSILAPYLIHIENEIMNLEMKVSTDKILRSILTIYGVSLGSLKNCIEVFLWNINKIINALKDK